MKQLKSEIKEHKKQRLQQDEMILEHKREYSKLLDRNMLLTDVKSKSIEELKKSNENQVSLLSKQNQELSNKWTNEKELKQKLSIELELMKNTNKKLLEEKKEIVKEKEKLVLVLKSKEHELDTLRLSNLSQNHSYGHTQGNNGMHTTAPQSLVTPATNINLTGYKRIPRVAVSISVSGSDGVSDSKFNNDPPGISVDDLSSTATVIENIDKPVIPSATASKGTALRIPRSSPTASASVSSSGNNQSQRLSTSRMKQTINNPTVTGTNSTAVGPEQSVNRRQSYARTSVSSRAGSVSSRQSIIPSRLPIHVGSNSVNSPIHESSLDTAEYATGGFDTSSISSNGSIVSHSTISRIPSVGTSIGRPSIATRSKEALQKHQVRHSSKFV